MTAKISITDHDSGEQIGQQELSQIQPPVVTPTPPPSEIEAPPSYSHPIPTSEPPLQEMAADIPAPEVPRFGTLHPKAAAHPLFSGSKEVVPKNRRWIKRTLAPILALLIVLAILYLAMDAGLVKGYSHLPFHFFKAPASTTNPAISPVNGTKATKEPASSSWSMFTSRDGSFFLNIADGLTLYDFTATGNVWATDASPLKVQPDTPAKILKSVLPTSDSTLNINTHSVNENNIASTEAAVCKPSDSQVTSFENSFGLIGTKAVHPFKPGPLDKEWANSAGTTYIYCFKGESYYARVTYIALTSSSDLYATVEEIVKTLRVK